MKVKALDSILKAWALWVHTGTATPMSGPLLTLGIPQSKTPIEERIEAVMVRIATNDLALADVIRLEFGGGQVAVIKRRKMRLNWKESDIQKRAKAMGLPLPTYNLLFERAKVAVLEGLK